YVLVVELRVDVVILLSDLAARFYLNRPCHVALGHGCSYFSNSAHLVSQVVSQQVHVTGEIFPGARGAGNIGLTAETSFDADFACHRGDLSGEGRQGVGHVVDRLGERRHFTLGVNCELALQVAVGHRGHDLDDTAHLFGEVGGHDIDVVGQILPRAGDPGYLRLTAELAFGAHLARHPTHFAGKRVELVDHRVDGVF